MYFLGLVVLFLIWFFVHRPAQNKNWVPEHSIKPTVRIREDGNIHITNIVRADYKDRYHAKVKHENLQFHISDIKSAWILFDYFSVRLPSGKIITPAHTLLSFEVDRVGFISISVAGRRVKGKKIGFSRVLPHTAELFYKFIYEADTLKARALAKEALYLYKLNVDSTIAQLIFKDMANVANTLVNRPRWFDTFVKNCTTETVKHLRKVGLNLPSFSLDYILTMRLEEYMYDQGLLSDCSRDTFKKCRQAHFVSTNILSHKDNEDLSKWLREQMALEKD